MHFVLPLNANVGVTCSNASFQRELACPLCDTVLAKDGVGDITLRPNDSELRTAAESGYGMQPKQLCEILQMGLDFWARQKTNEGIMQKSNQDRILRDLEKSANANRKISMVGHLLYSLPPHQTFLSAHIQPH